MMFVSIGIRVGEPMLIIPAPGVSLRMKKDKVKWMIDLVGVTVTRFTWPA